MESFEQFKAILKEKWLNYYKENQEWIKSYHKNNLGFASVGYYLSEDKTDYFTKERDDKYKKIRPSSDFIIGVITMLEPLVINFYMELLCEAEVSNYNIVKALGLNFDPDLELERIEEEKQKQTLYLNETIKTLEAEIINTNNEDG
jgi:hypothetical protein